MNHALRAARAVLAPMHGMFRKFATGMALAPRQDSMQPDRVLEPLVVPRAELGYNAGGPLRSGIRPHRPLRVVRVMESGQGPAYGGRMMISGRIADVCAELDRMAERETLCTSAPNVRAAVNDLKVAAMAIRMHCNGA